jgi:hypothetical protein
MGKKKSKVSKQKQAKARQKGERTSSLGGVAVSKGFSSKFQQANKSTAIDIDPKNKVVAKHITEASLRHKLKRKTRKVFMSPAAKTSAPANSRKDDEQDDFRRQMASMHERQMASTKKKTRKKNHLLEAVNFEPASFSLQKSQQVLLQETTSQMERMSGVGEEISAYTTTPIRSNQSWTVGKTESPPLIHSNAFDALGGDSGDEDNEGAPNIKTVPFVSLAPATFSLLPRITPTPATSPHPCRFGDEEDDPDL